MRLSYRAILLMPLLLLALAGCSRGRGQITGADASPGAIPDLAGTYVVNGVDPLGAEYGGWLTILAGDAAGRYTLRWIVTESIQEGAGMIEGNRLVATWRSDMGSNGQAAGVVTYTVTTKGELYGQRTVEGRAGVAQEKAFPNRR
jgi:hypothetical protein